MMRRVAARRHISDPQEGSEGVIIKRVRGKEVLVLVVTSTSPEVADLLRLDLLVPCERRALEGRSGDLQDGERRSVG